AGHNLREHVARRREARRLRPAHVVSGGVRRSIGRERRHSPRHDDVPWQVRAAVVQVQRRLGARLALLQLEAVLEVPHHVAHGRPLLAVVREAPPGGLRELPERVRAGVAGDGRVDDLVEPAPPAPLHRPLREVDLVGREALVDRRPRAQHLEEDDAEGVDVGAVGELPRLEVLRVEVAEAALHRRAHVRLPRRWPDAGQPEVGHLRHEAVAEEDVRRLDVAVDDVIGVAGVQVVEPLRRADADLQPLLPRQRRRRRRRGVGAVQVAPQGAVRHELVHEDHLRPLVAVADERDEVAVADAGEHQDLSLELREPLPGRALGALHGDAGAVAEHAAVHVPEPADAEDVCVVEVPRRHHDLGERDVELHVHPPRRDHGAAERALAVRRERRPRRPHALLLLLLRHRQRRPPLSPPHKQYAQCHTC
ncbi:Os10g0534600, partial [Oryza sativa Japonica Group]